MGAVRIFNCQVMKAKLFLDIRQYLLGWFVQPDPHELIGLLQYVMHSAERDIRNALATGVSCTIDDLFHIARLNVSRIVYRKVGKNRLYKNIFWCAQTKGRLDGRPRY